MEVIEVLSIKLIISFILPAQLFPYSLTPKSILSKKLKLPAAHNIIPRTTFLSTYLRITPTALLIFC